MSETRRAALVLIGRRAASFPSRYGLEESIARLRAAASPSAALRGAVSTSEVKLRDRDARARATFEGRWRVEGEQVILEGEFVPASGTQRFLTSASATLSLLVLASAWAIFSPDEDRSVKLLLPLFTFFAILALPFVAVALGSAREAAEARIVKAVRRALVDAEERAAR